VFRNAALFVDFFFVLSGFIMFHNYGNMATGHDFRRFLGLRLFRTYPLHIVMLLVFLAYETLQYVLVQMYGLPTVTAPFSENNAGTLLLNLVLLNGVGLVPLTFNTPSWSISTEFWAYVVFGLSMLSIAPGHARARLLTFGALGLGALAYLAAQPDPSLSAHLERFFPRCLYGFFLGTLLRGVMSVEPDTRVPAGSSGLGPELLQLATLVLSITLVSYASGALLWMELLAPFAFSALIASFVAWPATRVVKAMLWAPLLWLGKVSYSIYMVHQIVLLTIEAFMKLVLKAPVEHELIMVGNTVGALSLAFALALLLVVAALTYRFIEAPARRLGRTWLDSARATQPRGELGVTHIS
jgi:peptidoglycan/LPS O-acetylase OafA/YrhL